MKKVWNATIICLAGAALSSCGTGGWDSDYPYNNDVNILYGPSGIGVPVPINTYPSRVNRPVPVPVSVPATPGPVRTPATNPAFRPGMGPGPVRINDTMPIWKETHGDIPSAGGRFRRN